MRFRDLLLGLSAVMILMASAEPTFAATKKKKKAPKGGGNQYSYVNLENDGYYVSVGSTQVYCLNETKPGLTKLMPDARTRYQPLTAAIKVAERKGNRKVIGKLQKIQKKAKKLCKVRPSTSLSKYKGTFGYEQAARLMRVAGFGAPPAAVNNLVGLGLDAAVNSIIDSNISEPGLMAQVEEYRCDNYLSTDPEFVACDPTNENDLDLDGIRSGFIHYALNTNNQLQARLQLYLNDHVATSFRVLQGCQRYAAKRHADLLAKFARDGDLPTFLRDLINDTLTAQWLNRFSSTKFAVNEDWGREFLELFTIGKLDLDGNARYGDNEIIASSLAFTGLKSVNNQVNGRTSCYLAYAPDLHDTAPKTLWPGSPFQKVVYDGDDMVNAVIDHPGLAEYWALSLWKEFVNEAPSKNGILEAAEILRAKNYNIKELLRAYFKSQAFYAQDSQRTLFKLPIDFVLDVIRTTGMPAPSARDLSWRISNLGQTIYNPPTVFGWYTYAQNFMGARYILSRRNEIMNILDRSEESLTEDGFDFFATILADSPSADTLIERFSLQLGVPLTDAQKAILRDMMNYSVDWQGALQRDVYDSVRGSDNALTKAQQLYLTLIQHYFFSVK